MFPPRKILAFTLIEILAVIAIIAILAGILIPTTVGARTAANRARTRIQFAQWAAAIEAFRQEYGCYPEFDVSGKVNGGAAARPDALHPFHDLLAGRRRDGSGLPAASAAWPAPEAQNFRRMPFLVFAEGELFPAGEADPALRGLLHDGFGNTDIAVLVDRNLDGVIDTLDYPELPRVAPSGAGGGALFPGNGDFPAGPGGGVRAGAIFYAAPPRAADASQLILSWK
ncbi:MAG TPA: prepilin-type N-terminal cleavage/methylation domain-containing protein [Opitutaceae bacterium]|nr:prepilin-type N-terminal cleavage/methylation domain-containing protein [Opitutaceae bacterium]